jgi:uncharacterized protein
MKKLNPIQIKQCEAALRQLVDNVAGARTAVLSSVDGFPLAHFAHDETQVNNIAAMASSISALGDVISHEGGLGASRCVVVEASEGFIVVLRFEGDADAPSLTITATETAVMGQVLHFGRAARSDIQRVLA